MEFDFKNDWKEYVKRELIKLGQTYKESRDILDNSVTLFKMQRRIPSNIIRNVLISKEFKYKKEYENGLNSLISRIKNGETLTPYLSKSIHNTNYNDATLNEWGIHHFHLGNKIINNTTERTEDIAFVFISFDYALFIQTFPHGPGHSSVWTNTSLIEIIHNNWPDAISHMKTEVSGSSLTPIERATLRKKNTNVDIQVSDGTVYLTPGGGLMADGTSMADHMYYGYIDRLIDAFETITLKEKIKIKELVYSPTGVLQLHLDFSKMPKISELFIREENTNKIIKFHQCTNS